MKTLFALYEYSRIGFPLVKLKWTIENGEITSAYVTEKGVMSGEWVWHNQYPIPFMRNELERFDEWVMRQFQNDASVQGKIQPIQAMKTKLLFRITYRDSYDGELLTWEGKANDAEHAERLAFGDEGETCHLVSMHWKHNPLEQWRDSLA